MTRFSHTNSKYGHSVSTCQLVAAAISSDVSSLRPLAKIPPARKKSLVGPQDSLTQSGQRSGS